MSHYLTCLRCGRIQPGGKEVVEGGIFAPDFACIQPLCRGVSARLLTAAEYIAYAHGQTGIQYIGSELPVSRVFLVGAAINGAVVHLFTPDGQLAYGTAVGTLPRKWKLYAPGEPEFVPPGAVTPLLPVESAYSLTAVEFGPDGVLGRLQLNPRWSVAASSKCPDVWVFCDPHGRMIDAVLPHSQETRTRAHLRQLSSSVAQQNAWKFIDPRGWARLGNGVDPFDTWVLHDAFGRVLASDAGPGGRVFLGQQDPIVPTGVGFREWVAAHLTTQGYEPLPDGMVVRPMIVRECDGVPDLPPLAQKDSLAMTRTEVIAERVVEMLKAAAPEELRRPDRDDRDCLPPGDSV